MLVHDLHEVVGERLLTDALFLEAGGLLGPTARLVVPAEIVQRERDIQAARAKESGKPAEIAAKMVEGAVNKFLGEISLLGQPFVKDNKQSVEKMLAARKGKVNAYAFLVVGEGIEKH